MKIQIKAAAGMTVRDPISRYKLSDKKATKVTDTPYWRRRIAAGDVELVKADGPLLRPGAVAVAPVADAADELIDPPSEKEQRLAAILEAAEELEEGNDDHWTKDGRPEVRALAPLLKWTPSAAERDEAWASRDTGEGEGDDDESGKGE